MHIYIFILDSYGTVLKIELYNIIKEKKRSFVLNDKPCFELMKERAESEFYNKLFSTPEKKAQCRPQSATTKA